MTALPQLNRIGWLLASFGVSLLFILLWYVVARARLVSPVFLPGPERTWDALVYGLTEGDLLAKTAATIERMIYGWLLASLVGIVLGAAVGVSQAARVYVEPTLEFLRPLPASAMMPVAIALFGLTNAMVLAVIAFGALWPMLLATVHGFAAVEPRLYQVSRALGLPRRDVIWKIALPSAMPDILAGMRVGLTIALILAVVGEMLASRPGLGQAILLAARSFQSADLYAGVVLLGLIGYVSNQLLSAAESRLLKWRDQPRP
ncbi:MAG: ABC transporter permease [Pseudorhodoplanes sp.]|uniref:ABC transporter permease n=1 Tax=Pseudorhodoplanes sp. TaxID=1934341 RepID=UPI003D1437A2